MSWGFTSPRARVVRAWGVALILALLAGIARDQVWQAVPHPRPLEELSYYPSGEHLRPASLGHAETAADLAWLRAVQYYGEHRMSDNRFERMEHVFDILTTLSPGFVSGYIFGAFALAQEGQDFEAAEGLMLKGIEANPRNGRLAFELGFLYFVRPGGRDLNRAAEYFTQASRQPDSPPQALRFAAFARQHAGNLAAAYELWKHVRESSPNHFMREIAEREMKRIAEAIRSGHTKAVVKTLSTPRVAIRG
jgi:tetratricopeptide (TPR) repeat protein